MKKILIICDIFPPAFGPRMGYLCKYLKEYGWEPTVLTEAIPENTFEFLNGHCTTHMISFYSNKKKRLGKIQWIWLFFMDLLFSFKEKKIYRKATQLLKQERYQLILSSSYRTFPLPAARKAAKQFDLPLIVDLRDIIEQYTGNEYITHSLPALLGIENLLAIFFKKKLLHQRNKVLKQAKAVTTISPWHVEILKTYNPNTHLIYNGFDPEIFYPVHTTENTFRITYTGRLLSTDMRDPSLLFEALFQLNKERTISPENCRVEWYVDDLSEKVIKKMAETIGVNEFMDYKSYIPASEIPAILQHSSILLILTNRSAGAGPKGVMTTKFFESLAVEKPVLCIRSDESYLEAAVRETNAGLAGRNVKEVCDFLEYHYNEWLNKGYTQARINTDTIKKYSRKEQAGQFSVLFDTFAKEK